jgi:hypothetical protein
MVFSWLELGPDPAAHKLYKLLGYGRADASVLAKRRSIILNVLKYKNMLNRAAKTLGQ